MITKLVIIVKNGSIPDYSNNAELLNGCEVRNYYRDRNFCYGWRAIVVKCQSKQALSNKGISHHCTLITASIGHFQVIRTNACYQVGYHCTIITASIAQVQVHKTPLRIDALEWCASFNSKTSSEPHATDTIMSSKPRRVGQWLPSDLKVFDEWLDNLIKKVQADPICQGKLKAINVHHPPAKDEEGAEMAMLALPQAPPADERYALHPPVEDLKNAIYTDPEINMFFNQMFWQQYFLPNSSEGIKIPTWHLMIVLIDYIMTTAPGFNGSDLVGFPINIILNWPMNTTAGFSAFLNDKVNQKFKAILNYWADTWLSTSNSCSVLTTEPGGWFSDEAMDKMKNFVEEFECDPNQPHYGFKSWDDFFTRRFRDGIRPVASPDDDNIVVNACESAPYKLARNVKHWDFFWIKKQQYALDYILNGKENAKPFYGGTVYQAYLSAFSYHRWHSPVTGEIVGTELVDGSYYSQTHNIQDTPASLKMSQGYIAQVAARGIIYIKAENPHIGLMCFVSIGMAEVSTNEITVNKGDKVKKGDQLGMFHFGGSTHLLIFRPEVDIEFDLGGQIPGLQSRNINVKAKIAEVGKWQRSEDSCEDFEKH